MKTMHRTYSEEAGDFHRLCRFCVENDRHTRQHSTWCIGRVVDWKYGLYGNKLSVAGFCDKNACLWFDAFGEMAGFAISEHGDSGFAILTAAGYRFLFEEMLHWVLANWGGRGPYFSGINPRGAKRITSKRTTPNVRRRMWAAVSCRWSLKSPAGKPAVMISIICGPRNSTAR